MLEILQDIYDHIVEAFVFGFYMLAHFIGLALCVAVVGGAVFVAVKIFRFLFG
jgi:hypothetical protein